jgi:hypothetical protein
MAILTTTMTFSCATVSDWRSWAQPFGNAFSTLGWLNSNEAGAIQSNFNYGSATITNVSITSNVLTLTFTGATNQFASGQVLLLSGLTTNTFLNGQYIQIQNSGTPANDRTNTTVVAPFTHANTSSADTGTMTIVYSWSTVQNPPDTMNSTFPIGHILRFRGAFVPTTPTFTNLQTTANITTIQFGAANGHGLDLTFYVGAGFNIANVANASFTWLNTNPTGGWPIQSLTSTQIVINTGSSPRADLASTPVSAGNGSPMYVGATSVTAGTVTVDTVTYAGDLYISAGTNAATSFNAPGTIVTPGTDTTRWRRFGYDIWTSNDALSSTNKMYFKIAYGVDVTGTGLNQNHPWPIFYWGSGTDGKGNITVNYNWGSQTVAIPLNGVSGNTTDTALWESNFSGTSGRMSAIVWRGYPQAQGPQIILNIERSHDNNGNDTDAYWHVTFSAQPGGNSWISSIHQCIVKPGTGGALNLNQFSGNVNLTNSTTTAIPTVQAQFGQAANNSLPILPLFPLPGFVGNPMIGAISMKNTDTSDGGLLQATFYGTTHTYFMCTRGGGNAWGVSYNNAAGIRWE